MSAISSALAGILDANQRVQSAAQKIAQWGTGQAADTVSLSDQAVTLLDAKNENAANVKAAHIAEDMTQATLDMIA